MLAQSLLRGFLELELPFVAPLTRTSFGYNHQSNENGFKIVLNGYGFLRNCILAICRIERHLTIKFLGLVTLNLFWTFTSHYHLGPFCLYKYTLFIYIQMIDWPLFSLKIRPSLEMFHISGINRADSPVVFMLALFVLKRITFQHSCFSALLMVLVALGWKRTAFTWKNVLMSSGLYMLETSTSVLFHSGLAWEKSCIL